MKITGLVVFIWLLGAAAAFAGWVMNIVTLFHADGAITTMFIVRCIGIIVAPLGAVLGYL